MSIDYFLATFFLRFIWSRRTPQYCTYIPRWTISNAETILLYPRGRDSFGLGLEIPQREFQASVLGMIVVIHAEGDVDGVSRE